MKTHDYTWKMGLEYSSRTKLRTNKPLAENMFLIDLYNGHRYLVQSIYAANPGDREGDFLPDTVVHTWPVGSPLSEHELLKLRERAHYTPPQFGGPRLRVVFEPAAA
jgi:hypothetical protein